jgi:anthranilate synthase component 2
VVVRPAADFPLREAPPGPVLVLVATRLEVTHPEAGRSVRLDYDRLSMGARILVLDNYDSFVYNLVQELGELGAVPSVFRNDAIDVAGIREQHPDAVLISPGPGRPEDGGVSIAAIRELAGEIPLLGVCLGHQCIGQVFGGTVEAAPHLMHGKTSEIHHDGLGLFVGLPNPFVATRYHSLVVRPDSVPPELLVTATSTDGVIMGLRHRELPIEGVQFHPESVLTVSGPALLGNFLAQLAGVPTA